MSFPAPSVDMAEIESKYHSMAEQAGIAGTDAAVEAGRDGSKNGKTKKQKKKNQKNQKNQKNKWRENEEPLRRRTPGDRAFCIHRGFDALTTGTQ
jgi:hypothetical protein